MNVIRGMYRIAIILAIIALVPGFIGGWKIYESEKAMKVRWYGEKMLPAEKIPEEYQKKIDKMLPEEVQKKRKEREAGLTPQEYFMVITAKDTVLPPVKDYSPPDWQCTIGGVAGSIAAFLIVLFSICGMSRVIRWVIVGFKGNKN